MREIRELKRAPTKQSAAEQPIDWKPLQGLLFNAGLLVTLVALAGACYTAYKRSQLKTTRPADTTRADEEKQIDGFAPLETWSNWVFIRNRTLGERKTPEHIVNRERAKLMLVAIVALCCVSLLGVGTMVLAVVKKPRKAAASRRKRR